LAPYITKLNEIRRANPALGQLRNLFTHWSDDPAILVFSKHLSAELAAAKEPSTIVVVATVDPHAVRETTIHLDLNALGLAGVTTFEVEELLTGVKFDWCADNYVKLDAFVEPVQIFKIGKAK
jgi:starch synthase (maltosyl-transferring)